MLCVSSPLRVQHHRVISLDCGMMEGKRTHRFLEASGDVQVIPVQEVLDQSASANNPIFDKLQEKTRA